ncbi:lariat debranching enzyme, C-terminal domain-containing protein [Fomitopsis serialis]|uniref:lariat debranching enzyme, C-terminal domain-containing protein n=1 Tax=Fomitopsis serialis TaxID=139415 RepID=UPI0020075EE9|nr:lariat debranching enzyme, C-terminal domain-containing protein [Neoantrodia serialis]KAH9921010.1 lariat debranching enzyme, C-terminal domain-containing protein [Neoantrodia serialis]
MKVQTGVLSYAFRTIHDTQTSHQVAIEGCCHGELDAIYAELHNLEQRHSYKVDLLLICGDFQAIRNHRDLQCMAVPDKYRQLGEFWKYYAGEKVAPLLTLVIGGNHEASSYFWELYHGGWIAPNIYFLGHAGCVQVNGIRIAGASGIFKPQDFRRGHHERVPYNHGSMRSIYHIREYNVRKLSLLSSPTVFLSHDWPQGIEHHGDLRYLLRRKPHFRDDVKKGVLGSPPLMNLLQTLKPESARNAWPAPHAENNRHSGSTAAAGMENPDEITIEDGDGGGAGEAAGTERPTSAPEPEAANAADQKPPAAPANPDEIMLDDEVEQVARPPPPPPPQRETTFVALDKCLPRRQFLEVVDIPEPPEYQQTAMGERTVPVLSFDPEWLAITRAFHPYMSTGLNQLTYPDESTARAAVEKDLEWVKEHVKATKIEECQAFVVTAPPPNPTADNRDASLRDQPPHYPNPQTQALCSMLEIENKIDPR